MSETEPFFVMSSESGNISNYSLLEDRDSSANSERQIGLPKVIVESFSVRHGLIDSAFTETRSTHRGNGCSIFARA